MLNLNIKTSEIFEIDYLEPTAIFEQFHNLKHSALLTGKGMKDIAHYSFIGVIPHTIIRYEENATISTENGISSIEIDFWKLQKLILENQDYHFQDYPANLCGAIGYISYDALHEIEKIPRAENNYNMPILEMTFYNRYYVFDHWQKKAWKIDFTYEKQSEIIVEEDALETFEVKNLQAECDREDYIRKVEKIRDYIFQGDVYEVNLSQQLKGDFSGNSYRLFQKLYEINPAPFSAYLNFGSEKIVCNSPEMFLQADDKLVQTRPIKGTIARSEDISIDKGNQKKLLNSEKDQAELFMIIDLLRNDIGKVCKYGSVVVEAEKRLEAYENVYHLVGIIKGELRDNADYVDLWKATFPGGSISGCPKVRCMEIIHELESYNRHLYTGSIFIMNKKYLNSNIVIRSGIVIDDKIYFNSGGAVTIDSNPESEYEETLTKLQSLMKAVEK